MDRLAAALLSYVLLYKYAALFIFIFVASVGVPLPATMLLLAVGAFASQRYFNFPLSVAVAVTANVAGDFVDYWVTKRFGPVLIKKLDGKKLAGFDRLERYIKAHAGLTLFVTRFLGSLSTVTSIMVALAGMSVRDFLLYDTAGNLVDLLGIMLIGFFLGIYWENAADIIGIGGFILALAVLAYILRKVYDGKNTVHKNI